MTTDRSHAATWRRTPGYLGEGRADFESVHILLGDFLRDHTSPSPLPEQDLFGPTDDFAWGRHAMLEKVVRSPADIDVLTAHPALLRQSIAIIEPWEHVGINDHKEPVRASKNIAYVAQKIADADSILYPIWSSGVPDLDRLIPLITSGLAVVVEGGNPSVQDAASFSHPECPREEVFALVERLLLSRSPASCPAIFICLGHQLAAECLVRLLRRAVDEVLGTSQLSRDPQGHTLEALQTVCARIDHMGNCLQVRKTDGREVADHWRHTEFCVTRNEVREVGVKRLLPYIAPVASTSHVPFELSNAHDVLADELEGIIDTMLEYERDVHIAMFHGDEVNQEAILFANWAYHLLHNAIVPHRSIIAVRPLSWLLQLPYGVEILCSTAVDGHIVTECSATCISYKDFESKRVRRSFTVQFHPELLADLRDFGSRPAPSFADLKADDGIRLLVRLLYTGMQE